MEQRRIAIVSQHGDRATALSDLLAGLGYEVTAIVPFAQGLGAATPHTLDLIILDLLPAGESHAPADIATLQALAEIPILSLIENLSDPLLPIDHPFAPAVRLAVPYTDRELQATIELSLSKRATVRAAAATEQRFFDLSIDLLCFLDFSGYFKKLNPAWERLLGFSIAELMSRPFIEFVHPDDRERTLNQNRLVRTGDSALAFENRYRCKDGTFRWLRWNASSDTAHQTIYSVARDVTEVKRIEAERDALVRELQTALTEVRTLRDILPICSYCRKIRDDENFWQSVEGYLQTHTNTRFSHGICPSCMASEVEPHLLGLEQDQKSSPVRHDPTDSA